jgi:PAS domain S-box-containing protein
VKSVHPVHDPVAAAAAISRRLATARSPEFLTELVCSLAAALHADYCSVGELYEADGGPRVRTIALAIEGAPHLGAPVEYALEGTPCADVTRAGHVCIWSDDVQRLFPDDVLLVEMGVHAYAGVPLHDRAGSPRGLLSALFKRPERDLAAAGALLEIFAVPAAIDLERQLLEAQAERAVHLFEHSRNEIFIIDTESKRFVDVNRAARENLGYSLEEMRRMTPLDLRAPQDRPALGEVMRSLFDGTTSSIEIRTSHRRADGSTYPCTISVQRLEVRGRTYVTGIGVDTSERDALEAQLLHSQKLEAIGRLAGGVAHDLNNALTAILGNAQLCSMEHPGDQYLAAIDQAGRRAADVTRQLLAFARRQLIQPQVIDPNERIRQSVQFLRPLLGEDIGVTLQLSESAGHVRVDPGQFEQLLVNLAVNARDAMPAGGTLTIETAAVVLDAEYASLHPGVVPGAHVLLAVSDTGIGIPDAVRDRIFEPFFTTKEGKGSGLGLATVHGIVKQHGGHIFVESEPREGTTFTIYLPVADGELSPAPPPVDANPVAHKEAVLVVEDEAQVRAVAVTSLSHAGYVVLEADTAGAAEAVMTQHTGPLDVLVCDVVLPDGRGPAVAKRLLARFPDLVVLYTSGYAEDGIVHGGEIDPDVSFLSKPYTPDALMREIRRLLASRSPSASLRKAH